MNICYYRLCVMLSLVGYVQSSPYIPKPELGMAIKEIIGSLSNSKCYPTFIADDSIFYNSIVKDMNEFLSPWGAGVFEVPRGIHGNHTHQKFSEVVHQARRLRKMSWCVMVVLMSDDPEFLAKFAEFSLNGRLMVWSTKLLVVTRLPKEDLETLFSTYWTFSMNNAMALSIEKLQNKMRYSVLVHLPYTPTGAQVIKVAVWTQTHGLRYLTSFPLYPDKYVNFYGATVNVSAKTYEPHWITTVQGNTSTYSGIDYNQLVTLSESLNFVFHVLTPTSWRDMTDLVEARTSFIATVVTVVLPNRLLRWDYTHTFDYSPFCFVLAKPVLKPSWLSWYYPLSNGVWACTLASAIVVSFTLVKITGSESWQRKHGHLDPGAVVMETIGSLLGQGLYGRITTSQDNHILTGIWLMFGVVLFTGYRGSLIASLTAPIQPPRPENVEQLVKHIERATIEAYGISYKGFFTVSDSTDFQALGRLMYVGVHITQGLKDALTMKRAHVGGRQYLALTVAQHFTRIDGTTPMYIGKDIIIESASAWPIPHDAPYKPALDKYVIAITESGLYKKWRVDSLEEASAESRIRQRAELRQLELEGKPLPEDNSIIVKSLTVTHIQGPLMILLLGLIISGVFFLIEKFVWHKISF